MRKLAPYWYTPAFQSDESNPIEFQLKPLDQGDLYSLQVSFNANGRPSWEGIRSTFESGVIGWKNAVIDGIEIEFSRKAVRELMAKVGSGDWVIWMGLIAGELYRNGFLSEEEKKT